MEIEIAGNQQERDDMMPLLYISSSSRERAELESEVKQVLKDFHHGTTANQWLDPAARMKPLDVVKVLMGVQSSRESVKRFSQDNNLWARRQEYDYEEVLGVATETVQNFYLEMLPTSTRRLH